MPVYKSIVAGAAKQFYDSGQERDERGRWSGGGFTMRDVNRLKVQARKEVAAERGVSVWKMKRLERASKKGKMALRRELSRTRGLGGE